LGWSPSEKCKTYVHGHYYLIILFWMLQSLRGVNVQRSTFHDIPSFFDWPLSELFLIIKLAQAVNNTMLKRLMHRN
jgi:hypothetical protein